MRKNKKPTTSNGLGAWNPVITSLQKPFIRLDNTPHIDKAIAITENYWVVATHWVYKKKWNPKHRIPCKRDIALLCEPMGNLLLSILNLTEALHSIHPLGRHYDNAAMWFDCVCWEMKNEGLADLLGLTATESKRDRVGGIRSQLSSYRDKKNPHDFDRDPHTWRLIQAAQEVSMSRIFPTIDKKIWRGVREKGTPLGFLYAYSAWAIALESPKWTTMLLKQQGVFVRAYRGGGEQLLIKSEKSGR
jgi:hypothetical protein